MGGVWSVHSYPRLSAGKNQVGWFLSGAFSRTSLCVPSKTCTKISRPLFFFNGREIFVHKKGAFFSRPFFFIFHGNDGSGSSIFFSFP